MGLRDYGAAMPSRYFLDNPIFRDECHDILVTTDAELYRRHVRMMRHRARPANEHEFALMDYSVVGTSVAFYARLNDSLVPMLQTQNTNVRGPCELVFPTGPEAPREMNIASLNFVKKIDMHGMLVYSMNLTENRLILANGTVRPDRVRSRTPRSPRLR